MDRFRHSNAFAISIQNGTPFRRDKAISGLLFIGHLLPFFRPKKFDKCHPSDQQQIAKHRTEKKYQQSFFRTEIRFFHKKIPCLFNLNVFQKTGGLCFYCVVCVFGVSSVDSVSFLVSVMTTSLPSSTETPYFGSCAVTTLLPISPSKTTSNPSSDRMETASL